jgi:PAS domain S-box-containing protein
VTRVLVVDDHSSRLARIVALLEAKGIDIEHTADDATAHARVRDRPGVDVVISGPGPLATISELRESLDAALEELAVAEIELERRAAKLRARAEQSEERYRTLLEHATDAVIIADETATIVEANRQAASIFGRPVEELVGTHAEELLGRGHRSVGEAEIERPDGELRYVDIRAAMIEIGPQTLRLAILRDVTEQRKLRAQLVIADRLVSIGTMAAGVAHEINNPLTAIVTSLELAEREGEPSLAHEHLARAREAADRIRRTVRDIGTFSRAQDEEKVGPVDLRRVIEAAVGIAGNEMRHRARLVEDYGPVPPVDANESRLGQVFLNLLVNAVQAIPEGGIGEDEIGIRTFVDPASGRVIAEIRDSGVGMTEEVKRRLFTPFFTTKPPGVGTGLGLSICHRILTAIGGTIEVQTRAGVGTTFRVSLPASHASIVDDAPSPADDVARSRRGRVLVVDDEPMVAIVLEYLLSDHHDVEVVNAAALALGRIERGEVYDVILCDLMMPQMTGMDLYEAVRDIAPEQARRMIFLTGGAFTARAREFLDSVENTRVEKPFDPRRLKTLVAERIT